LEGVKYSFHREGGEVPVNHRFICDNREVLPSISDYWKVVKDGSVNVLEINTAPGIKNTSTMEAYVYAFKRAFGI